MAAYGRDIREVVQWTMPQLRMMARYRDIRERGDRRWNLILSADSMSEESFESLWAQLEGDDIQVTSSGSAGGGATGDGKSHSVDSKGNVIARGAPLLSDIALGKAVAPPMIPIMQIDKSKEEDA